MVVSSKPINKRLNQFLNTPLEANYWEEYLKDIDPVSLPSLRGQRGLEETINKPQLTSIRFAPALMRRLRTVAAKIDVPYQSYIKAALFKQLQEDESYLARS